MGAKYIIGVDEGSQSAKIMIFDLKGTVVCQASHPLRPMCLGEGTVVEHPDDDWWDAIQIACAQVMTKFDGNVSDILALGLCTIRFCRAYLDIDGFLAQPALSWMDARVSYPYPGDNPRIRYLTASSGYITYRFTGNFHDSAGNYQGVWPMDTDMWNWISDDAALTKFGVTRDMLFKLQMPGEIAGYVTREAAKTTGIPEGLPVVNTANDKAVEALGAGLTGGRTALLSLGTYIAAIVQGDRNLKNTVNFWTNFASVPRKYLYESYGIRRGMWMISWFKEVMGDAYEREAMVAGMSAEQSLDSEALMVPAGSDRLFTVLDWLAPTDKPWRKGLMIGFDGRHTRAHIYRSILEAIAMTMKLRSEDMFAELNRDIDELIVSGGGSNSALFMQITADVFGVPAKRNEINGGAGLGAAICAAVGVNAYASFDEAVRNMVRIRDTFHPKSQNTEAYRRMIPLYAAITSYTDGFLEKAHLLLN